MAQESAALKELMPEEVRSYLLEHPDFLEDNSDLLSMLVPPEQNLGAKVEDFQRYMLSRLQEDYLALKGEHEDLLDLMQEHMQRQNHVHGSILRLIDSKSFKETLDFITEEMPVLMEQDVIALFLESAGSLPEGQIGNMKIVPHGFIDTYLPECDLDLCEQKEPVDDLFGPKGKNIRSRALIRLYLGEGMPDGLLAMGHKDPMYFATGLATEQVEMLGAVVERMVLKGLMPNN